MKSQLLRRRIEDSQTLKYLYYDIHSWLSEAWLACLTSRPTTIPHALRQKLPGYDNATPPAHPQHPVPITVGHFEFIFYKVKFKW